MTFGQNTRPIAASIAIAPSSDVIARPRRLEIRWNRPGARMPRG
jgi:hypothetical protein